MSEKANKLESNKITAPQTKEVSNTTNPTSRYESQAGSLERQIAEINDSKKENTDMAGGMGDWIGEKTGAYETGKSIYEDQIKQVHSRAKDLFTKISSDLQTGKISEADKSKIQSVITKLEKILGTRLEEVSWGDAAMNDINKGILKGSKPVEYVVRGAYGVGEGAYDMVAGIAEISGKAIGIISACSVEPGARAIIKEDLLKILPLLTLENAKKVLALLPGALEKFSQLPPEKQVEGAAKFVGTFLAPIGIGGKAIDASVSIGKAGLQTAKTGARAMVETSTKIATELNTTGKITLQTAKEGAKAMIESSAMFVGGTTELGLAGAGRVGGTTIRYVGEFGAGGKKKIKTEKISKEANLAEKIKKAEARSGVPPEMIMKNAQLSPEARLKKANELLGKQLNPEQEQAILSIHEEISKGVYQNGHKELRAMVEKLDSVGISREDGRVLMENGVLGEAAYSNFDLFKDIGRLLVGLGETKNGLSVEKAELQRLINGGESTYTLHPLSGETPWQMVERTRKQNIKDLKEIIAQGSLKQEAPIKKAIKDVYERKAISPGEDLLIQDYSQFSFEIRYMGDDGRQMVGTIFKMPDLGNKPNIKFGVGGRMEIGDFMHLPNTTKIAIKSDGIGGVKIINGPKSIEIVQFEGVRNEGQSFLKQEVPINKVINSGVREKSVDRILSDSGEIFENSKIKGAGVTFADISKSGSRNQDRMLIDSEKGIMVSLDGMGGHGDGDKAAQILSEAIKKSPDNIEGAINIAARQMRAQNIADDAGTCFTYSKIREVNGKKYVDFYGVGDTKGVVISKEGTIKGETIDQSMVGDLLYKGHITEEQAMRHPDRRYISNYIGKNGLNDDILGIGQKTVELSPGDRVFTYSDGISDNLTASEISKIIGSETEGTSIIKKITEAVRNRRPNDGFLSNPKSDDISIGVFVVK